MCKGLSNILKRMLSAVIICITMLSFTFSPYFLIKVMGEPVKNQDDTHSYYASDFDLWFIDEADYWDYFNKNVTVLGKSPWESENILNYVLTKLGVVGDDKNMVSNIVSNFLKNTPKSLSLDTKGNFSMSADTLLQLRNLIEQEMKSKEPYKIYYPSRYPTPYYDDIDSKYILPSDSAAYVKAREYFDTYISIGQGNYRFSLIDGKKFKYAYLSGSYIRLVDNDLNSASAVLTLYTRRGNASSAFVNNPLEEYSYDSIVEFLGSENVSWSDGYQKIQVGSSSDGTPIYNSYHSGVTRGFCGQPIQVFNSLEDLYNYVNNKPAAYYTSDYYNKTYQDITFNQETINKYTTENVQNIYNTINNNVTNAVNSDELQQIIDTTLSAELDKISGSLDDVNKGLDGVNDSLNDIKDILNKILSTNEEFFKNDMEYLQNMLKALENSGLIQVDENGDFSLNLSSVEVNINFDELFDFLLEWNIDNGTGTNGGGLTDEEKNEIFYYIELYYEKLYVLSDDLGTYFGDVSTQLTAIKNLLEIQKDHDYGFYNTSFEYFSKSLGFDKDIIAELKTIKTTFTEGFDTIKEYLTNGEKFFEDVKELLKKINTKLGLMVAVDVADLLVDIFGEEEISNQLSEISSKLTAVDTMKTKFPLSIPWDIANIIVLLSSEPVAPKVDVDIPMEALGFTFDFKFKIDLSDYQILSDISRGFSGLTFLLYLYKLTLQIKNK